MYGYLTALGKAREHGGVSSTVPVRPTYLGWVCERAAGTRMADLVSVLLRAPIGAERDAEITCDGLGAAIHDGGMCATARDLARFGTMLLADGEVAGRPRGPGELASRLVDRRPGHPRRPRSLRVRLPSRRVVPQPVLVPAPGTRRRPALPGHPRADGIRQPGHGHGGRQAVLVAGRSVTGDAARHAAGFRRGRRHSRRARWARRDTAARPPGVVAGLSRGRLGETHQ